MTLLNQNPSIARFAPELRGAAKFAYGDAEILLPANGEHYQNAMNTLFENESMFLTMRISEKTESYILSGDYNYIGRYEKGAMDASLKLVALGRFVRSGNGE